MSTRTIVPEKYLCYFAEKSAADAAFNFVVRHYNRSMRAKGKYPNIHQALIDLCKRGDSKAQFEIYKLYYKAMYNTSLRIVGDATEAEDIMQESFFKAFDRISTYRNEVSFGAWLKRIVVNASLDFVKKRKLELTPIDEVYDVKDEADEEDFLPESVEQVKLAIEQLPDGFKIIVNLNLVEGYSHDEVAEMLGITASTSRSQLARAKQRLLAILKKQPKAL
ncbi:MAG: RNA polymerase sigma factor [Bacteroidales bacterium]